MPRPKRPDIANIIYHVINRANARAAIFSNENDYWAFSKILVEAKKKFPMEILAFCIMPNHWHLVLRPLENGGLAKFMAWLTLTHTQRFHAVHNTVGNGHLYQGRYKSFPVQTEQYFIQLTRYVERNPLRAGLVGRAEDWKWSSLWIRERGSPKDKLLLSPWPIIPEHNYLDSVNQIQPLPELEAVRISIIKNRPLGDEKWVKNISESMGLGLTLRTVGRPKRMGNGV